MTTQSRKLRTPLAAVRGLGSAKSGLGHWWYQRLTAIAMLPLVGWMVYLVVSLSGADYPTAMALISHPVNAPVLMLFIGVGMWHASLGIQVVAEDYISHEATRLAVIIATKMAFILLASISIFSILKIAL